MIFMVATEIPVGKMSTYLTSSFDFKVNKKGQTALQWAAIDGDLEI